MPASTTKSPSVYGKQTILAACEKATELVRDEIGDTQLKAASELVSKLFIKHLKEVLFQ